jgi:cytochrome d ubiquinol oxidase subunit I
MIVSGLGAWLWNARLISADPSSVLAARQQMAFTLGFHIVLVPFGVAFTFIMLIANYRGIRHGDTVALLLAKRWSKVAAVLFAVGAVSGTILSFELGLLWPRLMGTYGAAYGIPFAVEGIFFFLEAIFVAIYVYGWDRLRPWPHFWTGMPVVIAGLGGTSSVVAANGWMNLPGGVVLDNGRVVAVNPWAVYFNQAFWYEALHMFLAAYIVAGFTVASVYAAGMLKGRGDRYHRLGLVIPFAVAAIAMPLQIFVGDVAAREVFHKEPVKFAAMEALPHTGDHVAETIGGVIVGGQVRYGVHIPDLASYLSGWSASTTIRGLDAFPAQDLPSERLVNVVHLSFDVMVGVSFLLLGLSLWFAIPWWRRRDLPRSRWFLRATTVSGLLAVIALQTGWVVTEVGRQPWTVVGLLRTADAATTVGNVWLFFVAILVIYAAIGAATIWALRAMHRRWSEAADVAVPYGPDEEQVEMPHPEVSRP